MGAYMQPLQVTKQLCKQIFTHAVYVVKVLLDFTGT